MPSCSSAAAAQWWGKRRASSYIDAPAVGSCSRRIPRRRLPAACIPLPSSSSPPPPDLSLVAPPYLPSRAPRTCKRIVRPLQRPLVLLQEGGRPLVVAQHLGQHPLRVVGHPRKRRDAVQRLQGRQREVAR